MMLISFFVASTPGSATVLGISIWISLNVYPDCIARYSRLASKPGISGESGQALFRLESWDWLFSTSESNFLMDNRELSRSFFSSCLERSRSRSPCNFLNCGRTAKNPRASPATIISGINTPDDKLLTLNCFLTILLFFKQCGVRSNFQDKTVTCCRTARRAFRAKQNFFKFA